MYPEIKRHTFETRLVKLDEGYAFYRLAKDADGVLYYISHHPVVCRIYTVDGTEKLIKELKDASELPIIDAKDIRDI